MIDFYKFIEAEDYEITDVDSYADVRNYDTVYSVISIGVVKKNETKQL